MQNAAANLTFREIYGSVPDSQLDCSTKTAWGPINTGNPLQLENFYPLKLPLNTNKYHHSSGGPCMVTHVSGGYSQWAVTCCKDWSDVVWGSIGCFIIILDEAVW